MKKVTRLFDGFVPKNYNLALDLNPDKMTFKGEVVITGRKTGRPSRRLTFHQKDLKITEATITRHDKKSGDETIEVSRINLQKSFDEVRLHTDKNLFPGDYTVSIKFNGRITNPMNGLYPCYFTHDKQDKKLLATQFESHHAREVFPCIDEPEAKATFDLTLTTPDSGTVLANTPIKSQNKSKNKQPSTNYHLLTTAFERTPVMSTYLLAFVYGEIGYTESKTKRGTEVKVYATPDNVKFTDFALDTAVKVLEFYEDYFAIPYPLQKLDMIALPDFASGAMENWGLVTYREQTLLVDPKNTSLTTKQYVAMVIAHELAHQWFGNLVTMQWWTDLWLNEGFASWIEYLAVDHLFPDWQMWTQFIANEQQPALKLDSLDNTHAIEAPINHPDEIRSIFDAISYNKGASVIHMLYGYLGADDFRDGLRQYLKQHAYKNTVTDDLWAALEKASGKPVREFMHAWTSLPGFPLLKVDSTQLSQERFYMVKPDKTSSKTWPLPLLSQSTAVERLDNRKIQNSGSSISKFNHNQNGFYRTLYTPEILAGLTEDISQYDPLDRLGLLADSFETAKAGYGSAVDSLKLLEKYSDEDSAAVWDIIATNLGELRRVMDDDELREAIKPLVRKLVDKQLLRLGYKEKLADSHFDKLMRPTILSLAAGADEHKTVDWCLETFNKATKAGDVHPDLRGIVFTTAARHGGKPVFDKLLKFHDATDLSEERVTIAAALTAFEDKKLIERALSLVTGKTVRRQDAMYWVAYSFMNRHAKHTTWQWLQDNWGWLDKELGTDLSFYRTPIYAARSFSDKEFSKQYDAFFRRHTQPALQRSIKQGQEMLDWQIAWKQRDLQAIKQHLDGPETRAS